MTTKKDMQDHLAKYVGKENTAETRAAITADVVAKMNFGDQWRHKKRGSVVRVLYPARLQTSSPSKLLDDMEVMIIYREVEQGTIWVRSAKEFLDGRFEKL